MRVRVCVCVCVRAKECECECESTVIVIAVGGAFEMSAIGGNGIGYEQIFNEFESICECVCQSEYWSMG